MRLRQLVEHKKGEINDGFTVEAMAAGTFAMMDMTGFKLRSIKIVASMLAKKLSVGKIRCASHRHGFTR